MNTDLPTAADLIPEMTRLIRSLDKGLELLAKQATRWAESEDAYRLAQATRHFQSVDQLRGEGIERPTVDDKRRWVDLHTSKERRAAHEAEAMLKAAHEAVRSRRAQLSALQSVAAAVRAEAEISRSIDG
jgi:hypothetical protein